MHLLSVTIVGRQQFPDLGSQIETRLIGVVRNYNASNGCLTLGELDLMDENAQTTSITMKLKDRALVQLAGKCSPGNILDVKGLWSGFQQFEAHSLDLVQDPDPFNRQRDIELLQEMTNLNYYSIVNAN